MSNYGYKFEVMDRQIRWQEWATMGLLGNTVMRMEKAKEVSVNIDFQCKTIHKFSKDPNGHMT